MLISCMNLLMYDTQFGRKTVASVLGYSSKLHYYEKFLGGIEC